MNEEKMISVIIPLYNCEKYIKRCIESVINQTYKNIEIIIIDDGSSDNSIEIVNELIKRYNTIRIIKQENKGVSSARNAGIENSKGDYIAFLDADDWVESNIYETMINNAIEQNVDIVKCNYYSNKIYNKNYSKGKVYQFGDKKLTNYENEDLIDFVLKGKLTCAVYLFLIKKSFIEKNKIRFREDIQMGEDKEFCINLLTNTSSIYINSKPLYHYFYNMNGAMKRKDKYEKYIQDNIILNKYLLEILNRTGYDNELRNNILNNIMIASIERNIFRIYEIKNFKECIKVFYKYETKIKKELNDFNAIYLKDTVLRSRRSINYIKNNKINMLRISYFIQKREEKIKNVLRKIKGKIKEKYL